MYKVERLLRAIYRPHNVYCLHADSKSPQEFQASLRLVASCLPNVAILERSFSVDWGSFTVLEPVRVISSLQLKLKTITVQIIALRFFKFQIFIVNVNLFNLNLSIYLYFYPSIRPPVKHFNSIFSFNIKSFLKGLGP